MAGASTDWTAQLERWLAPFLSGLGHKARLQMCPRYIEGLIGPGLDLTGEATRPYSSAAKAASAVPAVQSVCEPARRP